MSDFFSKFLFCISIIAVTYSYEYTSHYQQKAEELTEQNKKSSEELSKVKKHLEEVESSTKENMKRIAAVEKTLRARSERLEKIQQVRNTIYESIDSGNSLKFNVIELTELSTAIVDNSYKYHVPISLVMAVIHQESAFHKTATSSVGAKGLMQIMEPTAQDLSRNLKRETYNLESVTDNVNLGTFYLHNLLKHFDGNIEHAIKAYNTGAGYVEKVENGTYSGYQAETVDYLQRVLVYKNEYESRGL